MEIEDAYEPKTFYFVYGRTLKHPFAAGWTEVIASCRMDAIWGFDRWHPRREDGKIRCDRVLTEAEFRNDPVSKTGNNGSFCMEQLVVERTVRSE